MKRSVWVIAGALALAVLSGLARRSPNPVSI